MGLISRQQAINVLMELTPYKNKRELINRCDSSIADAEGRLGGIAECIDEIEDLPPAQTEFEEKILAIGYTGKEGHIYIGGRLFAVRELAQ